MELGENLKAANAPTLRKWVVHTVEDFSVRVLVDDNEENDVGLHVPQMTRSSQETSDFGLAFQEAGEGPK